MEIHEIHKERYAILKKEYDALIERRFGIHNEMGDIETACLVCGSFIPVECYDWDYEDDGMTKYDYTICPNCSNKEIHER